MFFRGRNILSLAVVCFQVFLEPREFVYQVLLVLFKVYCKQVRVKQLVVHQILSLHAYSSYCVLEVHSSTLVRHLVLSLSSFFLTLLVLFFNSCLRLSLRASSRLLGLGWSLFLKFLNLVVWRLLVLLALILHCFFNFLLRSWEKYSLKSIIWSSTILFKASLLIPFELMTNISFRKSSSSLSWVFSLFIKTTKSHMIPNSRHISHKTTGSIKTLESFWVFLALEESYPVVIADFAYFDWRMAGCRVDRIWGLYTWLVGFLHQFQSFTKINSS